MERALVGGKISRELEKFHEHPLYGQIIEAVCHPTRWSILLVLSKHPEGRATFSELKRFLLISNNSTLTHHLSVLENAHLIENTVEIVPRKERGQAYHSYYSLTRLGKILAPLLLRTLIDSVHQAFPNEDKRSAGVILEA